LKNKTERLVGKLQAAADIVINAARCTEEDVVIPAASHPGFYGRDYKRVVDVFIGGQYGSEGKGQIISYLAKEYDVLVRVGGPNAGHSVYEAQGKYVYHQLPCRCAIKRGQTHHCTWSRHQYRQASSGNQRVSVDNSRLSIDPQTMVISQAVMMRGTQRYYVEDGNLRWSAVAECKDTARKTPGLEGATATLFRLGLIHGGKNLRDNERNTKEPH
jgi:hypothetical protein